jgi:hypothetical protein
MRLSRFAALAVLAVLPAAVLAQDKVDNPEFANWSKFKKGTSVTLKSSSNVGGTTSDVTITTTLVDVAPDKLVLEMTSLVKAAGMEIQGKPMKRDVLKSVPLPKGAKKEEFSGGKPPGTYEEGAETLKVGGTEVKAKWFKYKADIGGTKTDAKLWTSDEVPGMIVKSEMTTTGMFASTTKMEVTEIKKP